MHALIFVKLETCNSAGGSEIRDTLNTMCIAVT